MGYKIQLNPAEYIRDINAGSFDEIALEVYRYQYSRNDIYRQWADAMGRSPQSVAHSTDIPFLPISFFKTHRVVTEVLPEYPLVFESSGTTGETPSRHFVQDALVYTDSLLRGFREFYGNPNEYVIIGLLPSYLERQNASLVHMARVLMEQSGHPDCGFYLNEFEQLHQLLLRLDASGQKVLLIGVTFALLDFAAAYPAQLKHVTVMETGGMKGRREEWTRAQVHAFLCAQLGLSQVHSEYGMTELLSQAYAPQKGIFRPSGTMQVLVRDINDPVAVHKEGSGCLNIIDLANLYSCSFIATEDIGKLYADGSFEVLGRMDHAALRGCSLMAV